MAIKKGSIINGAYAELRISGLTVNPTPEYVEYALGYMDDKAESLLIEGYDIGWLQPDEYGDSDPDDDAGIEQWLALPLKIMLAGQLATSFGKPYDGLKVRDAMNAIAQGTVQRMTSKYPDTLPIGIANEDTYSPFFYGNDLPVDGS